MNDFQLRVATSAFILIKISEVLWGVDQYVADVETRRLTENTNDYMTNQVMVDDEYSLVRDHCRLRDELCSSLAAEGKFRIQFC